MKESSEGTKKCLNCNNKLTYIGVYNTGDYKRTAYKCYKCNAIIEVLL